MTQPFGRVFLLVLHAGWAAGSLAWLCGWLSSSTGILYLQWPGPPTYNFGL
jgi:hypothetical protein